MTSATQPSGWHLVPVSELISVSHGFAFKGEFFSAHGRDALTTPGNFLESGGFRHAGAKQRYYTASFPESYRLDAGDLIVAMTEQAEGLLGSAALVPHVGLWLHNQRIGRIRAKTGKISLKYLFYSFNSFEFRKSVAETSAGTKVKHTSPSKLGAVEILLPPRSEQERIVETLDDVDAMILWLERFIAKKQAIKQGMIQQLMAGKTRLSGFRDPWAETKLGEIGETLIGLTYKPSSVSKVGTLVLRSSNIQDGHLTFDDNVYVDCALPDRIRVRGQDILICVRNGSRRLIGKSVMLDSRVAGQTFGAFMTVFRSDVNHFLRYFFQSDHFKRQVDGHLGATINQITNGSLSNFIVAMPGPQEQNQIAVRLGDVDDEIDSLQVRLAKAKAVKQGMLQQLLTGRSRLPVEEGSA